MPIGKNDPLLSAVLFLLFTLVLCQPCIAGSDKRVLYLKNGTILRCWNYHYRNESYKVMFSRDHFTTIPDSMVFDEGVIHRHALKEYELDYRYDSVSGTYVRLPSFYKRERGFFFKWQVSFIAIDGMRLMAGYRINNYVAVGLGFGGEYGLTFAEPSGDYAPTNPNFAASYVYNSGYTPFFLYVTGDILKTQITPFYSVEAGYNLPWYPHLETDSDDGAVTGPYSYYTNYGGPTAGVGFGGRAYTRKRCNLSLSLNVNAGYVSIKTDGVQGLTSPPYTPIYVTTTSKYTMMQLSLRFSVGL